jgi:hypothetical protein
MTGTGLRFETGEHGGDYPDNMPQAITVTDAQGRWVVYVPLRVNKPQPDRYGESPRSTETTRNAAQPEKPPRRGQHRYTSITRHGPGSVTAEVVNDATGRLKGFQISRADDGGLDVEELKPQ